jgi:hypothetical protein
LVVCDAPSSSKAEGCIEDRDASGSSGLECPYLNDVPCSYGLYFSMPLVPFPLAVMLVGFIFGIACVVVHFILTKGFTLIRPDSLSEM